MRVRGPATRLQNAASGLLACLLAACGDGGKGALPLALPAEDPAFRRWPADTTIALRLPAPAAVAARPDRFSALVRALGREGTSPSALLFGVGAPDGVAPGTTPWAALTASGAWTRALYAADMAALRRAFVGLPPDVVAQETDGFLVLFRGAMPGQGVEPPLPPGDLALRVHHHPLLAAFAESGDVLEAGIELGSAGLDARGRILPGPGSKTADLLARAVAGEGGLVDFLPPSTFLRIETTLPSVFAATSVVRRLARHTGFPEEKDRILVERFLREALTGADPAAGLAIGCEARGGELTVVVVARDGDGAASPILKKLRADERSSFGPLVLDRRDPPAGLVGWYAWVAQAQPEIEDLPECLWGAAAALADESKGVPVAYAAFDGWSVVAIGPRADQLARATKSRLEGGSTRTLGAWELRRLRESGEGDYVIGVVVEAGAADLPAADLAAVRALFGGVEGARGPKAVAAAGFRAGATLDLLVRVLY